MLHVFAKEMDFLGFQDIFYEFLPHKDFRFYHFLSFDGTYGDPSLNAAVFAAWRAVFESYISSRPLTALSKAEKRLAKRVIIDANHAILVERRRTNQYTHLLFSEEKFLYEHKRRFQIEFQEGKYSFVLDEETERLGEEVCRVIETFERFDIEELYRYFDARYGNVDESYVKECLAHLQNRFGSSNHANRCKEAFLTSRREK